MKKLWVLLLITFFGCSIAKHGVFLDEMQSQPEVKLNDKVLTIKTTNSMRHSAMLIFKVTITTDSAHKFIFISAYQSAAKPFEDTFTIDLADYKVKTPESYSYFWLDPDKKATKLNLTP